MNKVYGRILDNLEQFEEMLENIDYHYVEKIDNYTYKVILQNGKIEYYEIDYIEE